jgi:hypothetical protein
MTRFRSEDRSSFWNHTPGLGRNVGSFHQATEHPTGTLFEHSKIRNGPGHSADASPEKSCIRCSIDSTRMAPNLALFELSGIRKVRFHDLMTQLSDPDFIQMLNSIEEKQNC